MGGEFVFLEIRGVNTNDDSKKFPSFGGVPPEAVGWLPLPIIMAPLAQRDKFPV